MYANGLTLISLYVNNHFLRSRILDSRCFLFILMSFLYIVAILPLHPISSYFPLSTKFRTLKNFWGLTSVPSPELSWVA